MNRTTEPLHIAYFSDVLCIWAYTAQIRIDELKQRFGPQIQISYHFIPIFGCTEQRIGEGWKEKGGYAGFGQHVVEVCKGFPHVEITPEIWSKNVPKSSASAHLFLKAVQLLEQLGEISPEPITSFDGRSLFEQAIWQLRLAFFRDMKDVGSAESQMALAEELGLPRNSLLKLLHDGSAMAALCSDLKLRD
ncbi:MAG TPA: disulfide bond formation protein DsbA, partial [Gammaproteobacteria bacterium]|nr:disulfide bond formation protein DsbA [Gammaproteobacteria bacterium]